ncbi:MAG: Hydroxyacylglutathione hydrolase [Pseudomonadales bacterium]|nr:Hydroxyacylglutathione hydrolase [Pseudomonadales bacterium]
MIEALSHGITCIDTGYYRPGLAACYLVADAGEVAVIETGTVPTLPTLLAALECVSVKPEQVRWIMPTHVHLDHAGGAGALLARCPNATLVVHPQGARHLIDPSRLIAGATAVYGEKGMRKMYGEILASPPERVREALDGSRWQLGRRDLLTRDTPGHANHHYCIWDEASRGWFTGDTFGNGFRELYCRDEPFLIPSTTPVQLDFTALLASIDLLVAAAPRYYYLTHFGRIEASEVHAHSLKSQLREYMRFTIESDPGQDRPQRLAQTLFMYTAGLLRAAGCSLGETELRDLLIMEMSLNAQGALVWLERQKAASA